MIDLTRGDRKFVVTTKVVRDHVWYVGEKILVDARNATHAIKVVQGLGYLTHERFPPREVKSRARKRAVATPNRKVTLP